MSLIKAVQRAFARMAPTSLAEAWDNTGLLVESPVLRPLANKVLLTIDLTPAVAEEALRHDSGVGVIVAYHPTIFRPLKALTLSDPLQAVVLKCAASGISIYSPHTALDSVIGGINDHLCQVALVGKPGPNQIFSVSGMPIDLTEGNQLNGIGAGGGRRVTFEHNKEIFLGDLAGLVKARLNLRHVQLAESPTGSPSIRSVGVCAGSGSSICSALGKSCDAFLTGEMSHHEILAATANGVHVILTSHTNTERFFLSKVLKDRLQLLLDEDAAQQTTAGSRPQWHVTQCLLNWLSIYPFSGT
ncbi:hypothetical protein O181_010826 [Austropuccinia psidii MF-1]|uniref:YbgI/family dinuclear metal center protein n=1 Tax=Austropuccinia psidii MF-1 TaxID=1389203 RepID=A0A9Q3BUM0_9BASI|nr:hypothetical protein [Austropuccinia psidii MF-1]